MKKTRRTKKTRKGIFSALVSFLLILAMVGSLTSTAMASQPEEADAEEQTVQTMAADTDAVEETAAVTDTEEELSDVSVVDVADDTETDASALDVEAAQEDGAALAEDTVDRQSETAAADDASEAVFENEADSDESGDPSIEELAPLNAEMGEGQLEALAAGEIGAFAFYCSDDTSLNFYYGAEPAVGDEYAGKIVTNVYTGFDTASAYSSESSQPWSGVRGNVTSVVFDESFQTVQPNAMAYWFYGFENAEFYGLENIDTSQVTSLYCTFQKCSSFTNTGGLSSWDTSNVTTMAYMFEYCSGLTNLDSISGWNTSKVTSLRDAFHECKALISLDISGWDTSKVTTTIQMFYDCSSITYLNVSGIVTSSATQINGMLRGLTILTEINISGWDTSNVTAINALFRLDTALETIYVDEDWDLSSVSSSSNGNLFYGCDSLVGGNGTKCLDSDGKPYEAGATELNSSMAHIDTPDNPGYFTDAKVIAMEDISGSIVWDDADDQDGLRPASVTVNLFADGDPSDSITVTAEDDWSFTFSDMPKYDEDLNEITYTITEDAVDGYESEITGDVENGFVVTNSHAPAQTDVSGTITWDDGRNQDGKRPSFVSVQLFAYDSEGGTLNSWSFDVRAPENSTYDNDGNEVWTWTRDGLDQYYGGGQEVQYTAIYTGVALDVYTQSNPDNLNTIYSYTPETTTISGSKTWVDGGNVENTRPASITVRLHANGEEKVYEQTVTAGDGWAWTFDDVPVYSNGEEIDYKITEDEVEDYYPAYDGWDITNTLDRGKTSITVMKNWEDANDQDGKRPASVTVSLLANGVATGETVTLSAENNWEDDFYDLAIDDETGTRITYTVVEETIPVEGYSTEITGDMAKGFVITNSYTPEKINVTGEKFWEDANDQDGMRPSSIYVHLLANGEAVDTVEVTTDTEGRWTFGFADLDKYAGGQEIEYTVKEVLDEAAAEAYTVSYAGDSEDGFTITNTHKPEMLNGDGTLTVTKVWDDDDDRDGIRPESVTIHLLADNVEVDSVTLDGEAVGTSPLQSFLALFAGTRTLAASADGWTATFTDLPKYANGKEIAYTVTEDSVEGYTAAVTGSAAEGYTVTNIHTPATINVNVKKVWDDEEDQDGKRPAYITINLLADGKPALDRNGNAITSDINESDEWEESFTNLYKYRDGGEEIVYTIEEDTTDLEGIYTTAIEGDMTVGFTVTNSHTPELYNGDGTFKVVLTWDDEANNDGIRPEAVHLTLTKNNTLVEGEELILTKEDADEEGNWVGTFKNLPKYEDGEEITYSINEDVYSGYTYRIELLTDEEDGKTYVQLTNVHVSVKEDIEITKVWDDADNQDGKRPNSITVNLLVNGNLYKERTLTASTEGVKVSEDGKVWTYTMSDIPVDKNGEAIEYTVLEVAVENYGTPEIETIRGEEVTDNGVTYQPYSFVVTNSHPPEQIEITGEKVWDDASNQDGKRPQFVTLRLYADGQLVESTDVSSEDAKEDNENVWTWAFSAHDKYADGKEIAYTVEEVAVEGYDTTITGDAEDGYTITNSYTPETTTISGSKTWLDDDNAEGLRPDSITVRLHANGSEEVYKKEVTAEDDWEWEFKDVPVYSNGQLITYTITEDALDNYDAEYTRGEDGTLNVTNTLDPGETSVTVEKNWKDNDDQDGLRPSEVTVALVKNGTPTGETLTLSEKNYWEDTFRNLEEYEGGVKISYTVQEVSVNGYDSEITGNATEGYVITNTHTPAKIDISGSKVWKDNDDQDGIRPDYITVHLMNGEETLESHTVNAENDWAFTFSDLDQYANGEEISYTIEEAYTTEGYEAEVDGYTITNTHEPEKIDITGTKTWDDDNNRDGIRPAEITINLYAGDDFVKSETVTAADDWAYTFADLDKCADGKAIDYSIREDVPDGYEASYAYFSYDVTNTHAPELFNGDGTLGVIMRWDDENDQDGIRPRRTTITLMLNGVPDETITVVLSDDNVDENGNWIGTFTDLYKYADGQEIAYNVEEGVMNGYTYTAELKQDESTGLYYVEITNTHAAVTSDITVTKVWDDNDNQDGIRPSEVTVNLFSNGSAVKSFTLTPGKEGVEVSADGNEWSYTFENMPVDQNGEPIIYTLDEVDVGSYAHEIDTSAVGGNEKDGITYTKYDFTVTNSHTPATTEVSVSKVWEDNSNQDGIRPHSITVELLIDGQPALDESGEVITGTMVPDTEDQWTYTFTGLDKYANGEEIKYGVEEFDVEGYEEISLTGNWKDGYVITNRHTPETTDISGNKVWNDDGNAGEYRPESIWINLYANGLVQDSREITADDDWAWTFTDLDVYSEGKKITYITTETAIDNYDTTYSGFTLTNTLYPGETSVTVAKDWEDEEDQDGLRPDSVTVELLADGVATGQTLTLSEADNWEDTFHELPIYDSGTRIVYTVKEEEVAGYTSEISGDASDGFEIVNTHTPETVAVSGSKTWDDADDQDGLRPDSIAVSLLADGEPIYQEEVTPVAAGPLRKLASIVTFGLISAEDDWSFSFGDLPKYENGKEITYTIAEAAVTGYDTTITGSAAEGFEIVNTHTPETMTISGTKVWQDANDQDGKRPSNITVNLVADKTVVQSQAVTDTDGDWGWSFTDVPKYEDGEEITYTVTEDAVEGYDTQIVGEAHGGYTIINSYTPETLTITGSKTWDDEDNQDGNRPGSVTVRLHKNGEVIATRTVTAYDGWAWTFSNQPKYEDGVEIAYTITEDAIDDYSATVDGYDVTNTYTPGQTSLTVVKDWEDANDQDGIRPEEITVELLADGTATGETLTLNETNGWEDTFAGLNEYESGAKIEYSVAEVDVTGYTTEITGNATEGYVVTNTHEAETITAAGSKTWDDNEDQDGKRPAEITIRLYADDAVVGAKTVTASDDWAWEFANLPKYENGKAITYTITEDAVDGYSALVNGYDVTNTHEPETVTVSGSKTWDDNNDQDGKRPAEITIRLHADGAAIDTKTVTAADGWAWEFDGLPKYENGKAITYTITEDALDDYSAAVSGYDVTNSYTPEQTSVTVLKDWEDNDDQDGIRPDSVTVELLADGAATGETLTLSEENGWEDTFAGLNEYESGAKIEYSVAEVDVTGYTSEITGNATEGYVVTNTHEAETITVAGSKTWDDNNDQDGIRPERITVNLCADDTVIDTKTVTASDGWAWEFANLPKYENGKAITYTITEDAVDGYSTLVNGYDVTNTHEPETITVAGSKTWDDNNDQDGKRPAEIMIRLHADGAVVDEKTVTAADDWAWTFADLPKYASGHAITYTITEDALDDYSAAVNGYDVTNAYTPGQTSVTVLKDWEDNDDQDGIRPDSVTVELLADGAATGETLTLNEANGWEDTFTELNEYESGAKIEYTVSETAVEGYTTEITGDAVTGYVVTNTHEPETVTAAGSKTWDDNNDQDGIRPERITVNLCADDTAIDTKTVTAADGWAWEFANLPKYESGKAITYTITEDAVDGYSTSVNGYDVTNTHEPETVTVSGSKTWDDNNDQDGKRPAEITIRLHADGAVVDEKTVTAADDWAWTFADLPKYADGHAITYTITEDALDDYSAAVNGYDVTNSYTPGQTSVTAIKDWEDNDDQDGLRPDSVTVELLADGTATGETLTLSEENGWEDTFAGLNEYESGAKIEYSVAEVDVTGYTSEITGDATEGYVVTNTHTPEPGPEPADKTELEKEITEAEALNPEDYTEESWSNLVAALSAAIGVLDDPDATQEDVDEALRALDNAIDNLEPVPTPTPAVDKEVLEAAIGDADGLTESDYTKDSWDALQTALEAAQKVDADENATQADVNSAAIDLIAAIANLEFVEPQPDEPDKTDLLNEYVEAAGLSESDYTPESWAPFAEALANARSVLTDPDATQDDVDAAEQTLKAAMDNLEPVTPSEVKDGLIKDSDGVWRLYKDNVFQKDYTGFAENENGKWYVERGIVTFTVTDILKDKNGAIGTAGDWYYVIDSKVQEDFTGLSNFKNQYGWWYIVNGKVDFTHNGVDKNCNGWWYVVGGKVQFGFTGLANYKNQYGWWYIEGGRVNFNHNGVDKNVNGWWYVVGSKVQFDFTGLANYRNDYGWWYIEGGKVYFNHNGVEKNVNGWWYVKDSKVDFTFTGTASNRYGTWYIRNGKVDFSYGGNVTINGNA